MQMESLARHLHVEPVFLRYQVIDTDEGGGSCRPDRLRHGESGCCLHVHAEPAVSVPVGNDFARLGKDRWRRIDRVALDRHSRRGQSVGDRIGEFRRRIGEDTFRQIPVTHAVLALGVSGHDHVSDAGALLERAVPTELHHRPDAGREPGMGEQCSHWPPKRRGKSNLHTAEHADIARELRQRVDLVQVRAVAQKRLVHVEDADEEEHIRQLLLSEPEHALVVAGVEFAVHPLADAE